jgi:molecular chaperone GrpE (heat shock protein)
MTAVEDTLADLVTEVAELRDLFFRRLYHDKDKRRLIDELSERAESGAFRQHLLPVVVGLAQLIDRIDRYTGPDPTFVASVREELLELLDRQGVRPVPDSGPFDPHFHEAVDRDEAMPGGTIVAVRRHGYAYGEWVFRPAQVVAGAGPAPEAPG